MNSWTSWRTHTPLWALWKWLVCACADAMHFVSSGRTALTPPLRRLQHHGANALDGDTPHINHACRRLAHSHLLAIPPMTRRPALAKTTGQLLHGTTGRAVGGLASGTNRSCQPLAIFLAPGPLGPLVQHGTAGPGTWDFLRSAATWLRLAPRYTWMAAAMGCGPSCLSGLGRLGATPLATAPGHRTTGCPVQPACRLFGLFRSWGCAPFIPRGFVWRSELAWRLGLWCCRTTAWLSSQCSWAQAHSLLKGLALLHRR